MKNLFAFSAVILLGLITGCQENQMTEPVNPLSKTEVLPSGNWIKIRSLVMDPFTGQSQIEGIAYWKLTEYITVTDPTITTKTTTRVKLEIIFDAELVYRNPVNNQPPNRIAGRTERKLRLTNGEPIIVVDTYDVENRENIVLVVKYGVSVRGVSIQQMYLREV